ncbi:MAG TPA: hypothetical protein VIF40_14835 [Methylosinus sp.]|uniref:hypothetical protein n=1 Tax=Methylosinus sp. TaxID=427 RepID=UPI002F93072F
MRSGGGPGRGRRAVFDEHSRLERRCDGDNTLSLGAYSELQRAARRNFFSGADRHIQADRREGCADLTERVSLVDRIDEQIVNRSISLPRVIPIDRAGDVIAGVGLAKLEQQKPDAAETITFFFQLSQRVAQRFRFDLRRNRAIDIGRYPQSARRIFVLMESDRHRSFLDREGPLSDLLCGDARV